jgi:hypothetical protein
MLPQRDYIQLQQMNRRSIPAPLEDARFRKPERIIIKAHFFVKGHSLKNKCNDGYVLLSFPQRAGL